MLLCFWYQLFVQLLLRFPTLFVICVIQVIQSIIYVVWIWKTTTFFDKILSLTKKWHHFFVLLFYLYLLLQSSLEYLVNSILICGRQEHKNRVFFGYRQPLSVVRVCIFILHFLLEPRKVVALCSVLPKLMHVLPIQITTMFWLNRLSPFSINDIGILIVLLRFIESICVVYRKTYKLFKIGLKFR